MKYFFKNIQAKKFREILQHHTWAGCLDLNSAEAELFDHDLNKQNGYAATTVNSATYSQGHPKEHPATDAKSSGGGQK